MELGNIDKATTPARTGAQHIVANPEKTPSVKTEPAFVTFNLGWTENGIEKCRPNNIDAPRSKRNIPPIIYIGSWNLLNNFPKLAAPMPSGKNTVKRPRKNTKVIKRTFRFSLKIEPRYDGSKTVMQQGANNAATPATNAVMSDAIINVSIYLSFSISLINLLLAMAMFGSSRVNLIVPSLSMMK